MKSLIYNLKVKGSKACEYRCISYFFQFHLQADIFIKSTFQQKLFLLIFMIPRQFSLDETFEKATVKKCI